MQTIATYVIIAIILTCFYFWTYRLLSRKIRTKVSNAKGILLAVLALAYLGIFGYLHLMIRITGSQALVVYVLLILAAAGSAIWMIGMLAGSRESLNKKMLLLFFAFLAAVFYVTVVSRRGSEEATIKMIPFENFAAAIRGEVYDVFTHFVLNIVMFVPLGFFFAGICPEKTGRIGTSALLGLSLSVMIETVQMIFRWGECDINDIIANTLGAAAGCLLLALFYRTGILHSGKK